MLLWSSTDTRRPPLATAGPVRRSHSRMITGPRACSGGTRRRRARLHWNSMRIHPESSTNRGPDALGIPLPPEWNRSPMPTLMRGVRSGAESQSRARLPPPRGTPPRTAGFAGSMPENAADSTARRTWPPAGTMLPVRPASPAVPRTPPRLVRSRETREIPAAGTDPKADRPASERRRAPSHPPGPGTGHSRPGADAPQAGLSRPATSTHRRSRRSSWQHSKCLQPR
jgi:hypothetical protein